MRLRPIQWFAVFGLLGGSVIAGFAAFGFFLERQGKPMLGALGWSALFELGVGVIVTAVIVWRRSGRALTAARATEELPPAR